MGLAGEDELHRPLGVADKLVQPLPVAEQQRRSLVGREAAAEGIVLLKNEQQALPLEPSHLTKVALIGPNAKVAQTTGGGSAQVNAHYAVTPFEDIVAKLES